MIDAPTTERGAYVDAAADWAGCYVHVPFCARVCPYCDFAVVEGRDDQTSRYFDALTREIEYEASWRPFDAVFVGGGTPSHVEPGHLVGLVATLRARFGLADDAEVTLEANPEDWRPELAARLVEGGFTRVSFGAQSLDPSVLAYLGRRHTPDEVDAAVSVARQAGFRSISVDLIMGAPGETLASWRASVEGVSALDVDHVSAYGLTVERGTPLGRSVAAGAAAPDPDDQADKYELAQEMFEASGLVQYEVSNYARRGHECRYNLCAWAQGEYLAFGVGAHSHRRGRRAWRARRLDTYLQRIEDTGQAVRGEEQLDDDGRERERLMLGVRRAAGVEASALGTEWIESVEGRRFVDAGIVELQGSRLVVIRPLMTDAVARSILGGSSS